jgi:sigma-B regulation protein RsbU (phosphoserine phosphatase)
VANAGLVAPLLWRNGHVCFIDTYGLPLGAVPAASYFQQVVALEPGDSMLLCSDGVVEAMNSAGALWGFDRLEAAFGQVGDQTPEAMLDAILHELGTYTADAPQHDDMTLVALQVLPA